MWAWPKHSKTAKALGLHGADETYCSPVRVVSFAAMCPCPRPSCAVPIRGHAIASAGNRTRVTSMATMYSTTRPLMLRSQAFQTMYRILKNAPHLLLVFVVEVRVRRKNVGAFEMGWKVYFALKKQL